MPVPADPGAQFRSAVSPQGRRAGLTGRVADIRRWARNAGLPRLGEKHVRAGTSSDAFFYLLARRLARGTSATTKEQTMPKRTDSDDLGSEFRKLMGKGAAEARRAMTPTIGGLDTYAGIGRADEKKPKADDTEDEGDFEAASADDEEDENENDEDAAKDEAARKRGADTVRNLRGRGVRGTALGREVQAFKRAGFLSGK